MNGKAGSSFETFLTNWADECPFRGMHNRAFYEVRSVFESFLTNFADEWRVRGMNRRVNFEAGIVLKAFLKNWADEAPFLMNCWVFLRPKVLLKPL